MSTTHPMAPFVADLLESVGQALKSETKLMTALERLMGNSSSKPIGSQSDEFNLPKAVISAMN
jgi:hypothetical protein